MFEYLYMPVLRAGGFQTGGNTTCLQADGTRFKPEWTTVHGARRVNLLYRGTGSEGTPHTYTVSMAWDPCFVQDGTGKWLNVKGYLAWDPDSEIPKGAAIPTKLIDINITGPVMQDPCHESRT